jgi:hypothetical protein
MLVRLMLYGEMIEMVYNHRAVSETAKFVKLKFEAIK